MDAPQRALVVDHDAMFIRLVTGLVVQIALVLAAIGLGYAAALGHVVPSLVLAVFVTGGGVLAGMATFGLVLAARQHSGPSVW